MRVHQLTRPKRGAPIGNRNAMKHGRYSPRVRAARWAEGQAERDEARRKADEWTASAPKVDYDRVIDELRALRAELDGDGRRQP